MQIYVVRHGKALDYHDPQVTSDEMRWLIDEGRDEVATVAALLARLGVRPDVVLSSPLVRARETAEILASELGVSSGVTSCDELAPGGSPAGVLEAIVRQRTARHVVVAGHMPGVSRLVGYLVHQDAEAGFGFQTGAIARVELLGDDLAPGAGRLRWLIPPSVAARLLSE